MLTLLTAALLLAAPLRTPLTRNEAFEASPAAPVPEEAFAAPPRWPGTTGMLLGGSVLTAATIYGAYTTLNTVFFQCPECSPEANVTAQPLRNTGLIVGGGVLAMLAGMGYLAWAQDAYTPRALPLSRIEEVEPLEFRLEIPLSDFQDVPGRLSVEVERDADHLTVKGEQAGCHLRFRVDGDKAVLDDVVIRSDVQGRFFQQVLGALLVEYQGDFRGMVAWSIPKGDRSEVVVNQGESYYPLLAVLAAARRGTLKEHDESPVKPPELTRAERLQAEGRAAYAEYERLKAQRRN